MTKKRGSNDCSQPPSSNDQRSNVQNPNNPAYKAAQDNRANQLNPMHPAYEPGGRTNPCDRTTECERAALERKQPNQPCVQGGSGQ